MKMTLRYGFVAAFLAFGLGLSVPGTVLGDSDAYQSFLNDLNSGKSTITLGTLGTGPILDDEDPVDFVLDNPIEEGTTIKIDGTAKIQYNEDPYDPDGEKDSATFQIDIGGGKLTFSTATNITNNYSDFSAFFLDGGELTFGAATTISNSYSGVGVFYVDNGTLTLTQAKFSENYGADSGGVVNVIAGSGNATVKIVSGITAEDNRAELFGGVLSFANYGASLDVEGAAIFRRNHSLTEGGGAVYGSAAELTFHSTVEAATNDAFGSGGAFYIESGTTLIFEGTSTFTSNVAQLGEYGEGGGAIYVSSSTLTFGKDAKAIFGSETSGDTSKGNKATTAGGAIFNDSSTIDFGNEAIFGGNAVSAGSGGAIYTSEGSITFGGAAYFRDNSAADDQDGGGAIYASGTTMTFNGATEFSGNKTSTGDEGNLPNGGAVFLFMTGENMGDELDFGWTMNADAKFSNNVAVGSGGAIYASNSLLQFKDTVDFSNNSSGFTRDDGAEGGGGAIYADMDSVLHFNGLATFTKNSATKSGGGAVFLAGSGSADSDNPVLGLYFKNGATFTENSAVRGGAVYLESSVVTFGGTTTLKNNTATGDGGAFYSDGQSLLHFEAGSTTAFSGNTAAGKGGAIYLAESSELTLKLGNAASVEIGATAGTETDSVYLAAESVLNIQAGAGSKLTINSALAGDSEGVSMSIIGPGTVELNGDTSGFEGSLSIDEGTLKLGYGSGTLGNLDSTVLTLSNGASVFVDFDDNDVGSAGRLQLSDLQLEDEGQQILFDIQSFITDSSDTSSYALLSMRGVGDQDEDNPLLDYIDRIGWTGDVTWNSYEYDKVYDEETGDYIWTLYVYVIFDPNEMAWEFTIPEGDEKPLDKKLDTLHESGNNKGKELSITGGTLVIVTSGESDPTNRVAALNGLGGLRIETDLILDGKDGEGKDFSAPRTFSGNLDGPENGSVTFTKQGTYTQQLFGKTGDGVNFVVEGGTLEGTTDSLRNEITIDDDAILKFDQNRLATTTKRDQPFEGTLIGTEGSTVEIKAGLVEREDLGTQEDGILRIEQENSGFYGTVDVQEGWFLFKDNGSLANAKLITVGPKGGLGGSGTVLTPMTGDVRIESEGAIQAYEGDLNIGGDLYLQKDSIVYFELGGADMINVEGTISIEKGIWIEASGVAAEGYAEGQWIDFPLSGGLIDLIDLGDGETILDYIGSHEFSYDGKTWELSFMLDAEENLQVKGTIVGDAPDPVVKGLSRNQAQVAVALATIKPLDTTSQQMKDFITQLDRHKTTDSNGNVLYDEKYLAATKQLAGTVRAEGLRLGLFSPSRTVFNRLALGSDLYGGSPMIYNNGYGPISGMESHGAGAGPMTYRGQLDPVNPHFDGCAPTCDIPCMMGENNFWADVTHVQMKGKGDGDSDEYGFSRTGLLIGMDVQKKVSSRIGFLFGYFAPYLWQNSDRVEADDYHGGVYFQKNHMGTDLYGYFGYAHQEYRSRRFVNMSAIDENYGLERYNGKTRGDSFNFSLELSKPRYYGHCYVLRPLIALDYNYTKQKGYREGGAGIFGLRYSQAKYDQWFVRLGVNLKKETIHSSTVLRIQYINQFGENAYPDGGARFVYSGSPVMNVRGVNLGTDYLNLGLGFNLFMNEARSKFISFDYDFNTSRRMKSHAVSLVLVERF